LARLFIGSPTALVVEIDVSDCVWVVPDDGLVDDDGAPEFVLAFELGVDEAPPPPPLHPAKTRVAAKGKAKRTVRMRFLSEGLGQVGRSENSLGTSVPALGRHKKKASAMSGF
jgi:hypothetical protein